MLSEIDLKDFERLEPKPLFDIERNTYIESPVGLLLFDHIDGMYSLSTDLKGNMVHLAAWTEVVPLKPRSK